MFRQFTTVGVLDEQIRKDDDIPRAKIVYAFLQSIQQHGITEAIFEQLNSRAINNKVHDIPSHALIYLLI